MTKILITGVAGNIGSALAGALLRSPQYEIIGIDNFLTGSRDRVPPISDRFRFIKADVNNYRDICSIFYKNSFDYVFHFAAVVGVERTLQNGLLVLNDIESIKHILHLSSVCSVKRVFYSSSSEVYGEPVSLPQHEYDTPLNSRLPYAIVKNVCEAFCRSYYQEHGLKYTILRFFNTYGPGQSCDFVIPRFVKASLDGEPIYIHGDGSQTRTFCYVSDNVDTMINLLESGSYVNEIINIGSSEEVSILELARKVIKITNSTSRIEFLPPLKEGDMSRRLPSIDRMMSVLQRPLLSLEDGLRLLVSFQEQRR